MARTSSIDTLIDLAKDHRDEAAKALGVLNNAHQLSQQQLDALIRYRQEYREQLDQAMNTGVSMARLDNFQRFLTTLDLAIAQQTQAVSTNERRVDSGKRHWQSQHQRYRSFDVLAQRRRDSEMARENRREQQDTDEHAGRSRSTLS